MTALQITLTFISCAIASREWAWYAESRKPRTLGYAVFTTLLALWGIWITST